MDEFVTKIELNTAITELEKKMASGFNGITKQLTDMQNSMELNKHTDLERFNEIFLRKSDAMQEAINRANNPRFMQICYPIVSGYLDTNDGKLKLGCAIDEHFANKRDNASKWINFLKLIAGAILTLSLAYGGTTIVKSNNQTQKALINAIGVQNGTD